MDYDKQRRFLARQRRRLLPPLAGCALLAAEAVHGGAPLWAQPVGTFLALGLAVVAYYLPNYLCLDANPRRRFHWLARARRVVLLLATLLALVAKAWGALTAMILAEGLHEALKKALRRAGPPTPLETFVPPVALTAVYGAVDVMLLWLLRRAQLPEVLLVELLLLFFFLALVPLRPRSAAAAIGYGLAAAGACYFLAGEPLGAAGAFLWIAGVAWLLASAEKQNRTNYQTLVESLEAFTHEPRPAVVELLAESTRRLAEDWNRSRPQGEADITAWYSRNARYYLYDIAQHHLLYKHIVYTHGLLRLARGRVLDFGGGNGDFSCALAHAGVETTYLDVPGLSADFLAWRIQREGLRVEIVHALDALHEPFDVIFALDVLEHLPDVKPVLAHWKDLLRPGGRLVCTYYTGPASSAPMHLDPGFDVRDYLLTQEFRDVKPVWVGLFSPELLRKKHFIIVEKEGNAARKD